MAQLLSTSPVAVEQILNSISLGLILVDAEQRICLWNGWIERHSGVAAEQALGRQISEAFEELPSRAILTAISNTLNYGLPVVLSNALHRSPLPLFDRSEQDDEKKRIHQSITITPLSADDGSRLCLIQVSDSSTSIKREKILRTHSEALKREATTDSLTGIYNRRFFDEHYKIAMGHAVRNNVPLSIFMLDIDFFKEYNDSYGHVAGDKTLIQVAAALRKQLLRATDVLARFGGEEFILMLPNMAPELAMQFAEKLRTAVWDLNIPHINSRVGDRVSISIGFSNYHKHPDVDQHMLLKCADAALYEAKKTGRNRSHYLPLQDFHVPSASIAESADSHDEGLLS
ncbi:diguanylate cyclase [Undibacterium sp. Di26W]|uniref:sensor domain-containing diguanylate cyclase n=1 Tax=Undibacterium sp. Di26W TaxID=3413035 RepID=UPI003BF05050